MANLAIVSEIGGVVHQLPDAPMVPIGGKLPLKVEVRTSQLLDMLVYLVGDRIQAKDKRKRVNEWLYTRCRPGFYVEFDSYGLPLHLAYADQRDGHGTQHYWRLFFDKSIQATIERLVKKQASSVGNQAQDPDRGPDPTPHTGTTEWGGMYFRSQAELAIAKELNQVGVLFFANVRGRIDTGPSPIAQTQHNGRLELDFLVFRGGKVYSLEVDGSQHNGSGQAIRDYGRDRLLLREGIPTARFTAQECLQYPAQVVQEFLALLPPAPPPVAHEKPPIDIPVGHAA